MPYKDIAKRRENRRTYYQSHKEYEDQTTRLWMQRHREQHLEVRRHWRQSHKEELNAKHKLWRQVNKAAVQARLREYIRTHPKEIRETNRRWRELHPDASRTYQQRREARKRNLTSTLTVSQWEAIKAAYQYRCAYCSKPHKKLTQDHVIPIFKGGATTMGNIVPACPSCNYRKHTNLPQDPVRLVLI